MALGERAAAPALEWLLHEIERECTGEPMLIFIDEAWRLLNDPVSAEWFYGALRTLRKRNAGLVMATQSITEIASSPYCNLLIGELSGEDLPAQSRGARRTRQGLVSEAGTDATPGRDNRAGRATLAVLLHVAARQPPVQSGSRTDCARALRLDRPSRIAPRPRGAWPRGRFPEAWLAEHGIADWAEQLIPQPQEQLGTPTLFSRLGSEGAASMKPFRTPQSGSARDRSLCTVHRRFA